MACGNFIIYAVIAAQFKTLLSNWYPLISSVKYLLEWSVIWPPYSCSVHTYIHPRQHSSFPLHLIYLLTQIVCSGLLLNTHVLFTLEITIADFVKEEPPTLLPSSVCKYFFFHPWPSSHSLLDLCLAIDATRSPPVAGLHRDDKGFTLLLLILLHLVW